MLPVSVKVQKRACQHASTRRAEEVRGCDVAVSAVAEQVVVVSPMAAHQAEPILPEYTDTFGSQAPMQYEDEEDTYTDHQHHAASFLQEVVGEIPPALVHRNPFGPPHNTLEASQIEAEMDLAKAAAHEVGDSDMEIEETAQEGSTDATAIIQEAKKIAENSEGMPFTLDGFTNQLPTDVAALPPPFRSEG